MQGAHPMANDNQYIVRLKKRLKVHFGIEETGRVAFTENVSLTGMFIRTPNIYPPNTRIRIEFELANNKVELEARVMWAKKVPQNLFILSKRAAWAFAFFAFILERIISRITARIQPTEVPPFYRETRELCARRSLSAQPDNTAARPPSACRSCTWPASAISGSALSSRLAPNA
jgi:hypothetical protein